MDLTQRQALAELLRTKPAYDSPLAALVGDASANVRAGVGTAKAVTPTWRQKTAGLLQDGIEALGTDRYRARRIAETLAGGESSNLPLRMGLLDPTMIGAAFGRQESPNMGPGAPGGLSHAATVFHGSPHKFDRFDSSKIGTGEGAQAYGHGLYLAESPAVAKSYQNMNKNEILLGSGENIWDIVPLKSSWKAGDVDTNAIRSAFDNTSIGPGHVLRAYERWKKSGTVSKPELAKYHVDTNAATEAAWQKLISRSVDTSPPNPGSLYSVDLPDPLIARMLDWDKPLSQQAQGAAVKRALDARYGAGTFDSFVEGGGSVADLIKNFDDVGRGGVEALLRQQGIPGIRYLDGGSRSAGAGSSNFVVFPGEESALRILTRNGAPLP